MSFIPKSGLDLVRKAVRALAEKRREAGFVRIDVWVPQESEIEMRRTARRMIAKCGRRIPGGMASAEERP